MKINDSFQNFNFAQNNFKVRASGFCFSKERAQTRAQAARSFLEGPKPVSPRSALRQDSLMDEAKIVASAATSTPLPSSALSISHRANLVEIGALASILSKEESWPPPTQTPHVQR